MARIRSIKVDLFMDDGLESVSLEAHFLLAGLPVLADRAGRLEDRPKRIQAHLFPYRPSINVDACLDELAASGHVTRYEAGGVRYLQVSNWEKDQRPHVKEALSLVPPATDSTEPRLGSESAGNSPGTRRGESAGIRDSGLGVLDSGSGIRDSEDLPPASRSVHGQDGLPLGVTAPTPKKRKPPAEKPPADPRHQPLVDALFRAGWTIAGGRGAKAVKDLLALADEREATRGDAAPGEVSRRATLARAHAGFPSVRSLWELATHWAHFETAGPTPNVSRGGIRAETQDHTKPQEPF